MAAAYAGSMMAVAGVAEGLAVQSLGGRGWLALLASAWGAAWLLGYSWGVRRTPRASGRRLAALASLAAGLAGLALARAGGPLAAAGYALATAAAAAASAVAVASVYREEFDDRWPTLAAAVKAVAGTVQAAALLAVHLAGPGHGGALAPAAALLALATAATARDPPVSPVLLKLVDDLTGALARMRPPSPPAALPALAGAAGALAMLKLVLLPDALEAGFYQALALLAATSALGAALAASHPSPRAAALAGAAAALATVPVEHPHAELALASLALGYADATLVISVLEAAPHKAPRAALTSAAWLFATAQATALAYYAGAPHPEALAAAAAATAILATHKTTPTWE